jgi:putative CocE/NonD family hydrolase
VIKETSVGVPMRDRTILKADVHRPSAAGRYPILVIVRSPYGDDLPQVSVARWIEAGYAVVVQDCRGRWRSEGEWTPIRCEPADGYDTVEWAARQPWSNGRVGTSGSFRAIDWARYLPSGRDLPKIRVTSVFV